MAGIGEFALSGESACLALHYQDDVYSDQKQRACITEGLRINAIATSRSVRAAPHETLRYKDWVIEPGTPVGMNTHFTHLSSEIFPEAMKYDPYRWLNAEKEGKRAELEKYFNPFGKGSRNCVGLKCVFSIVSSVFPNANHAIESAKADAECCDVVLHTQSCM